MHPQKEMIWVDMDWFSFLVQTLNAVQYGLLLFLVAAGLTLIFGIMRIINLAHGSFYMMGAYLAFVLSAQTGNFFLALTLAIPIAYLVGALLEKWLFIHLYHRDHLDQVLLTYGLILIFEEVRSLLVDNDVHGVSVPDSLNFSIALSETLSYPVYRLFVSGICIALVIGLYLLIHRTRLGMIIRAGSDNRKMVEALGINIDQIYCIVFAIGATLAAISGMLAAPMTSVYPHMGDHILITSFVVVVIGGLGSIWGTLIASILIGLADTFGKVFFPEYSGMTTYFFMAAILLFCPQGLIGKKSK